MTEPFVDNTKEHLLAQAFVNQTPTTVSFIGLGAMGYRMASHLPSRFDTVYVWNRTSSKAEQHAQQYQTNAVDLATAVSADVIFSCLPTSADVENIVSQVIEQHALTMTTDDKNSVSGKVWVDCTSGVPSSAQSLSQQLLAHHVAYLDAPVSGQTIGADNGTLTVMVGGNSDALAYAAPAIECFAGLVEHVGENGAGFAVKAINNILLAVNLWGAAEGLSILKAHKVNLSSALNCINASSGMSLASNNIIPNRVLSRQFPNTFALDLLAKDCSIAVDLQAQQHIPAPVLSQVASLTRAASNQHTTGSADFSQLVQLLEQWTGQTLE